MGRDAVRTWKTGLACVGLALVLAACGRDFSDAANLDANGEIVVVLGDSIARGFGVDPTKAFPALLDQRLDAPVLNAGKDGDTTATGLRRLQQDVLRFNPRVVVVELSGNDRLRRRPKEDTFRDLDRITKACVEAGAIVVLVHAKYGILNDPYREGFRRIAERHGAVLVEDILRGILANPSRMYDQIHPNEKGHALIAKRLAAVLEPLLAEADQARAETNAAGAG